MSLDFLGQNQVEILPSEGGNSGESYTKCCILFYIQHFVYISPESQPSNCDAVSPGCTSKCWMILDV